MEAYQSKSWRLVREAVRLDMRLRFQVKRRGVRIERLCVRSAARVARRQEQYFRLEGGVTCSG